MTNRVKGLRDFKPSGFSTTRWTLIVSGAALDEDQRVAHEALAQICRTYWRPIYSFVCRRIYSPEDAQDITQDFFAMILGTNWLRRADQNRGRFRSLLLVSLNNFINDALDKTKAQKRGGSAKCVSWDDWMAEAPSQLAISPAALESMPPEMFFDLRWAVTVVERALNRLSEECEQRGRLRLFDTLSSYLSAERVDVSYERIGATLGISSATVMRQLSNLRRRYRFLLRDEIRRTLRDPADLDDEIRHLFAVLGRAHAL